MDPFIRFLKKSPTAYHAVEEIENVLQEQGAQELLESDAWKLHKGKSYYVKRGGSLIAFTMPSQRVRSLKIAAAHTDSPALKLKPQPEYEKEGMAMIASEIYGGPLLSSWLNRDLKIAGRVLFEDKKGAIKNSLVDLHQHPLTIPQLAIHLDRKVNEEGLLLNKQEHLNALWGLNPPKGGFLIKHLEKAIPSLKKLLAHDLFLCPIEEPCKLGAQDEFIAAYRLDNLASVYPILEAFKKGASKDSLNVIAFWDHEEIGSETSSGAASPFFSHLIERVLLCATISRDEQLRILAGTNCLSVDLAHALHPNYPDKHDMRHKPRLEGGVLLKTSAQKRYATEAAGTKFLFEAAKKAKVEITSFAPRNDLPSGTTIGPIHASITGINTVDIGIAMLSMHSARELIARKDIDALEKLLTALFKTT